jgi:coenzyme PQQ precursor peptide PqqA
MERERDTHRSPGTTPDGARWETPRIEVIPLSCEITSYAPDDDPLF